MRFSALASEHQRRISELQGLQAASEALVSKRLPLDQALLQHIPETPNLPTKTLKEKGESPMGHLLVLAKCVTTAGSGLQPVHGQGSSAQHTSPFAEFFKSPFVANLLKRQLFDATTPFTLPVLESQILRMVKCENFDPDGAISIDDLLYTMGDAGLSDNIDKAVEQHLVFGETWSLDNMDHVKLASSLQRLLPLDISGSWLVSAGQYASKDPPSIENIIFPTHTW